MAKGNGSSSLDDLSARALEIAKRRQAAATAAVSLLEDRYETTFEAHAGTLLRAMAWLAGTSLYRSFGLPADIPPGSPVLSDQSNEQAPMLLKAFMFLIDRYGVKVQPEEVAAEIPAEHRPRTDILTVQSQFQHQYNETMKQNGFDFLEGGKAGAVACAQLVRLHCQDRSDLLPAIAVSTVSMGFVEGSKTAPAPLRSS